MYLKPGNVNITGSFYVFLEQSCMIIMFPTGLLRKLLCPGRQVGATDRTNMAREDSPGLVD